jgi:hypothetical protein
VDTNVGTTAHLRCHHCGYDLHGVASHPRCPECGKPILRNPETFARRRLRRGRTSFLLEKPRPHPLAYVALVIAVVGVAVRAGLIFIEATANV